MPYIRKSERERAATHPTTAGELNYAVTRLLDWYLRSGPEPVNYQRINDALGALEGAKLEMYRRVAGPYEDRAIRRNGDVYSLVLQGQVKGGPSDA